MTNEASRRLVVAAAAVMLAGCVPGKSYTRGQLERIADPVERVAAEEATATSIMQAVKVCWELKALQGKPQYPAHGQLEPSTFEGTECDRRGYQRCLEAGLPLRCFGRWEGERWSQAWLEKTRIIR